MILKPQKFRYPIKGHPLAKGLVGCWMKNEGAGNKTLDLSGNRNNLTKVDATWTVAKFGSGLYFNGSNNYLINTPCPNNLKFNDTQAGTVIVWFQGVGDTSGVLCGSDRNTVSGGWSFEVSTSYKIGGYVQTISQFSGANARPANGWSQLVFTYNAAYPTYSAWYYVNGLFTFQYNFPAIGYTATRPFVIGVDPRDLSGNSPIGTIDHAMIYNRALSASEIAQLYREPFAMFGRRQIWPSGAASPPAGHPYYYQQLLNRRVG